MKKTIYFLQQKKYYGFDGLDSEDIEENMIIGYFTSKQKLNEAIKICVSENILEDELKTDSYDLNLSILQNYVFVLSHAYSKKESDGSFTDYEYIFPPKQNKEECIALMNSLKTNEKYSFHSDREYDIQPPDGFLIEKYKLNCVWFPIYKKL